MSRSAANVRALALTAVLTSALIAPLAAPAALAGPGAPDAPMPLFNEDFENTGASPVTIEGYNGVQSGADYAADPSWDGSTTTCNGLIVSFSGTAAGCPGPGDANEQLLAQKLGLMNGSEAPDDNHAVGENTDASVDTGDVELELTEGTELAEGPGKFLVGGVDVAVLGCPTGAPLFSFVLIDGDDFPAVEHPLSPEPQSACAPTADLGDGVTGGRVYSDDSVLSDFVATGYELHNANTGEGAYHGLDNFLIADATPQLDQSFASTTVPTGGTADLTFTITNTTDLASKQGWSFSGELPSDLTVASGATAGRARSTTCAGTTVTAPVGGHAFSVSGGLATDQTSCTATIGVKSPGAGSFTVNGSTLSLVGLRLPGDASVTFADPVVPPPPPPAVAPPPPGVPAACADGADNDGDGRIDRNDPGCVLAGVYQPQKNSEANIAPLAQCAAGALQLTDVFGRDGRTVLTGVAGPDHVGKAVSLVSAWDDKTVAKAVVKGDLSFATTAKLPPRSLRDTNAARYQARLGNRRSLNLKFSRRMTETVASRLGSTRVKIGGRVTKPLADPRAKVVVRAAPSCQSQDRFRGVIVARDVKVSAGGTWSASITLPKALRGDKVFLRATTQVRQSTRSRNTFETFTLIQGVALK